ncbi:hypothetical protein TBLA_0H02910 [Henningerozyma blattae CBS 6284]|uniref:Ribosome-releasing factor 2, mitochondrial n=1 Tax=Henningerozyma blattae (strain ATCC 34711 / CBS 6284 / DSM 70876 / NBRC 10599 / NRRL Y-10934 / UCD 77-7) TaxID=1071380 RepID=I2H873_HENB6|nr:hypothetical protein TBLA_0H02910 [Tetrapisispora blattae CBS 6284]CCH62575.1 hypothetical protein TBLA_0H02910 [Tetrapisispora blattae CBS 6284]
MLQYFKFLRNFRRTISDVSKIRNIGIVAHIDAGKTTTTERMLYYSGKINRIGNVDQGNTTTDYLPQERERGITIQSAAVSFNWPKKNDFRINLIDTPGHVDFSFEILKSLKVIDGEVVILDAVSGVQAQTEKIWHYSRNIPKICFINKMDRTGASFNNTVRDIIQKLKARAIFVNIPYFKFDPQTKTSIFNGVIDILNGQLITWSPEVPDSIQIMNISNMTDSKIIDQLEKCRESIIDTLSEFDEELVEYFLNEAEGNYDKIPGSVLNKSIRKATLKLQVIPILCGASFRNIGIQPLLDSVCHFLPSPIESKPVNITYNLKQQDKNTIDIPVTYDPKFGLDVASMNNLAMAFVFKVMTDPIRGIMILVRIYSGILNSGSTTYNPRTKGTFRINNLGVMNADEVETVKSLHQGEIGVIIKGKDNDSKRDANVSNELNTGDTILSHSYIKKNWQKSLKNKIGLDPLSVMIEPINIPPPVFSASVEPKTLGNKLEMEKALHILCRDDPSLTIYEDEESGQTVINGMGDLHLQIAKDKLVNNLKANVNFGEIRISYKETLRTTTSIFSHPKQNTGATESDFKFTLSIEPHTPFKDSRNTFRKKHEVWYPLGNDNNYLVVEDHISYHFSESGDGWRHFLSYETIVNSLIASSIAGLQSNYSSKNFPLYSCAVRIKGDWKIPFDCEETSEILRISRNLIVEALESMDKSQFAILEPIMNVVLDVPQSYVGLVTKDLTGKRNASIDLISETEENLKPNNLEGNSVDYNSILESQYFPPDPNMYDSLAEQKSNESISSSLVNINAKVPLKNMMNYSNQFRSITQGHGSFILEYSGMNEVSRESLKDVLDSY